MTFLLTSVLSNPPMNYPVMSYLNKIHQIFPNSTPLTFLRLSFLFALLTIPFLAVSQTMSKNAKGERIVVFDDGSWQLFDEYMSGSPKRHSAADGSGAGGNYPIFNGTIAPLEGGIEVTEADLYLIATRRFQLAKEAAQIAQKRFEKAQEARTEIEQELEQMLKSTTTDQQLVAQLNTRLQAAQRAEEESRMEAQEANVESKRAEFFTQKGHAVAAYQEAQKKRQEEEAARREAYRARSYEQSLPLTDNYVGVNQQDLILNPPQAPCQIVHEGVDNKSGNFRKQLKKQFLFSHTDDRLRVYLKDKEYMRCEGYFSTDGGYSFLTLEFTFAYPNAHEAYGIIEEGSVLTIKMLNDDFVNLYSGEMVQGSYDTKKEILTYRVHYPISRSDINYLKDSEVDAIRVFWSSGFEEYEVYHLDFFANQLRCID